MMGVMAERTHDRALISNESSAPTVRPDSMARRSDRLMADNGDATRPELEEVRLSAAELVRFSFRRRACSGGRADHWTGEYEW